MISSWNMEPLPYSFVRKLDLQSPAFANGPLFLSAASGIVAVGPRLLVIGDDQVHLGVFDSTKPTRPGQLLRLFPQNLPDDHNARKRQKPDLEVLVVIPGENGVCSVLALPSGSEPNRVLGSFLSFNEKFKLSRRPMPVDFTPVYRALKFSFPELNIEGALAAPQSNILTLFQRGNGSKGQNATIDLNLSAILAAVTAQMPVSENAILHIRKYDLGHLDDVALSFTDAVAVDTQTALFVAAAEKSNSTYHDGEVVGSLLGFMNLTNGRFTFLGVLPKLKVEGLAIQSRAERRLNVFLVTDADDPNVAAELLLAEVTWPYFF